MTEGGSQYARALELARQKGIVSRVTLCEEALVH